MTGQIPQARVSTDGVFFTLQGEGPMLGMPSVFVRLDTCNLKCKWGETLCDAHYTSWTPSGRSIPTTDLVHEVHEMTTRHRTDFVVITGGEPAVQPGVVRALTRHGRHGTKKPWHVTLETNGTKYIEDHNLDLVCLSPKLRSSTPIGTKYEKAHERARWNPDAIRAWMHDGVPYYFKFVVDRPSDMHEVGQMLSEVGQTLPDPMRVCVMPQGVTAAELWERGKWVAEECKAWGMRFTPRIQVDLWGNTPGT